MWSVQFFLLMGQSRFVKTCLWWKLKMLKLLFCSLSAYQLECCRFRLDLACFIFLLPSYEECWYVGKGKNKCQFSSRSGIESFLRCPAIVVEKSQNFFDVKDETGVPLDFIVPFEDGKIFLIVFQNVWGFFSFSTKINIKVLCSHPNLYLFWIYETCLKLCHNWAKCSLDSLCHDWCMFAKFRCEYTL